MQFPWAFEFTQDLLLELVVHSASGRFGDFFCNSMRQREGQLLWLKTPSLFKYLSALWKLGRFRHGDYIPTKTVLRPRTNVRDMMLWDEVYCRFTAHDKDRHSSSIFNAIRSHSHSAAAAVASSGGHLAAYDTPRRAQPRSPSLQRAGFGSNWKKGRDSPVHRFVVRAFMVLHIMCFKLFSGNVSEIGFCRIRRFFEYSNCINFAIFCALKHMIFHRMYRLNLW